MTDTLETNSRTLKQARRGKFEIFVAIVAALVTVVTAASGLHYVVQIVLGAAVAVVLVSAYWRLIRVQHYRRQDHALAKNRKPSDEEDGA